MVTLVDLTRTGTAPARTPTHARVLLLAGRDRWARSPLAGELRRRGRPRDRPPGAEGHELRPWRDQSWCIPGRDAARFVAPMGGVRDLSVALARQCWTGGWGVAEWAATSAARQRGRDADRGGVVGWSTTADARVKLRLLDP